MSISAKPAPRRRLAASLLAGALLALPTFGPSLAAEAPAPAAPPHVSGLGDVHYMVLFRPGPNWIADKPYTQQPLLEHGKYLQSLYDRRILLFAGPFMDNRGGFAVLDCPDEATAKAIAADEPATRTGVFVTEVHPIRYAFDQAVGRSVWPSPKP